MFNYERLLEHAKGLYPRHCTKEGAARNAALDVLVVERQLTHKEREALCVRLVKDILSES